MKKKQKESAIVNYVNIDRLLQENMRLRQENDNAEERYLSFKASSDRKLTAVTNVAMRLRDLSSALTNENVILKNKLEELNKQFDELVSYILTIVKWFRLILQGASNLRNCSVISLYNIKFMVNNMLNLLLNYQKQQPNKILLKEDVKVSNIA